MISLTRSSSASMSGRSSLISARISSFFLSGHVGDEEHHLVQQVLHRQAGQRQLHLAGLDLGHVEDLVYQHQQVLAADQDVVHVFLLLVVERPEGFVEQHLGKTVDGIERRPEFVRHVGEEFGLGAGRPLELRRQALEFLMGLAQTVLYLPALGDVLDHEEDDPRLAGHPLDLAGVQQHDAPADGGEIVLDFVIVERCLEREYRFQEFPQLGDVPLLVPEIVDELPDGFFGLRLENLVERAAGGDDAQVLVQGYQGFANGIDDALGVFPGLVLGEFYLFQFPAGLLEAVLDLAALGDILDGEEDYQFLPRNPLDLAGVQQHDAAADGREVVLDLVIVERRLLRQDRFKQLPQLGDVPLLVSEIVDELADRFLGLHLEEIVERSADRNHPQVLVQGYQGFPNRIDDALRVLRRRGYTFDFGRLWLLAVECSKLHPTSLRADRYRSRGAKIGFVRKSPQTHRGRRIARSRHRASPRHRR